MKKGKKTKMTKLFNRVLAAVIAAALVTTGGLTLVPMNAYAEEESESIQVSVSVTDSEGSAVSSVVSGTELTLTAVLEQNGETLSELPEGDYVNWWYKVDGAWKANLSSGKTTTITVSDAGSYEMCCWVGDSSNSEVGTASSTVTVTASEENGEEEDAEEEDTEEAEYTVSVTPTATSVTAGDSIGLSASVARDGEAITDMTGYIFLFWLDTWNDHADGNSDGVITNKNSTDGTASVQLPTVGTYYIVGSLYDSNWGKLAETSVTLTAAEGYSVSVSAGNTSPAVGDTVSLTATVLKDGVAVTDLSEAGLQLWWWTDTWADGHTDGLTSSYVTYSNYDNNSGNSLSADVTATKEGTAYVTAELKSTSDSSIDIRQYTALEFTENTKVESDLEIDKVVGLDSDFIMGVDISSVLSELESGVKYYDYDGNDISDIDSFCAFLKSQGITHVRVRVWNDPYDSDGNGYGGGNNDVSKAKTIADACRNVGLKMLVDFHCSDFWTDPGKYTAPKAWAGYTVDEKATALEDFISTSLNTIDASKDVVEMVQVGNETTGGFVGETNAADMCTLFNAGSAGVREYNDDVKVVIHVTNPNSRKMTSWAATLSSNDVDYDVLATSYYPYWHGTLDNLKSEMETVENTYGKAVMVAETSYAYTLEDSDGHDNTVREGKNDSCADCTEVFSVQGQATSIRNLIQTVSDAGGLGVFYWEPAWITVGDTTGLEGDDYTARVESNKNKWEANGSGWASSYSSDYDPDDAGVWYGGSAVDNEAMFYPDGTPTAGWQVWNNVKTGAEAVKTSVLSIGTEEITVIAGNELSLPETVTVNYNKGKTADPVVWNSGDVAKVDTSATGTYTVSGTVTFSKEVTDGTYSSQTSAEVTLTVTVSPANLITDADAAGFEDSSLFTFTGSGIGITGDDHLDGTHALHWYNADANTATATYNSEISLASGKYKFRVNTQGYAGDTVTLEVLDTDGGILASSEAVALTGWDADLSTVVEAEFTLSAEKAVKLAIVVDMQDGGWGTCDSMYLYRTGDCTGDDSSENESGSGNSSSESAGESSSTGTDSSENGSSSDSESSSDNSSTSAESGDSSASDSTTGTSQPKTPDKITKIDLVMGSGNGNVLGGRRGAVTQSVTTIKNASAKVMTQGPACRKAFAAATPTGYSEGFEFSLLVDGKANKSLKSGQIVMDVPSQLQKSGRVFTLLAMGKDGKVKTYRNLDTTGKTLNFSIDVEGYAFSVIYSDGTGSVNGTTGVDAKGDYYVVQSGDTLSKISRAVDSSVLKLLAKNGIMNKNRIKAGQKIYF